MYVVGMGLVKVYKDFKTSEGATSNPLLMFFSEVVS